jgi:hypothetical protein
MTVSVARPSSTQISRSRFDKVAVAALTHDGISEMTSDDMVAVIETVSSPTGGFVDLATNDRPTLERLVYLARRTCRNQGY